MSQKNVKKALENIRILDLSRVLAGPFCTQILGDLGADVLKIEKPHAGDDTRSWGPPYLQDENGTDTGESAYYLSCNRNKRSVAIDIKTEQGRALIHDLLAKCDVLIENFKVGGLKKYGLDYETVSARHPHIVYCSITGYGQSGPLAPEPGYDFVAQGMAGLMACTGEPDGQPMKVGVALSDIMTGMNAAIGILAALNARMDTGKGQHIDLSLVDCTLASLTNIAQYYLTSDKLAPRLGNAHSTIVPYQAFETSDGHIIVAIGNDTQFARFAKHCGHGHWAQDERFATNSARVTHRDDLVPQIIEIMKTRSTQDWLSGLQDIDVPCGPVNTMEQAFAEPQVQARDMQIAMNHAATVMPVSLVGSPIKMSGTPVTYRQAPPVRGEHTNEVLRDILNLEKSDIESLAQEGVIELKT